MWTMLAVVEEGALVKIPDSLEACPEAAAAASASVVDDLHLRQVIDKPARLASPSAEVGVLKVHEKPLVHRPDLLQRSASEDHARPGDPVDLRRAGGVLRGGEKAFDDGALWEEPDEEGGASQEP